MALHENVIFSLSWVAAPGTIGIYIGRTTGAGMNCLSPLSGAQEVVRLLLGFIGGRGDAVQEEKPVHCATLCGRHNSPINK